MMEEAKGVREFRWVDDKVRQHRTTGATALGMLMREGKKSFM